MFRSDWNDLDKTIRKYKQQHGFKIDDDDIVFVDHVDKIKKAATTTNSTDNENANVAPLKGMYIYLKKNKNILECYY